MATKAKFCPKWGGHKYIGKSKIYSLVYEYYDTINKVTTWQGRASINRRIIGSTQLLIEREAAVAVDMILINAGRKPINILKSMVK